MNNRTVNIALGVVGFVVGYVALNSIALGVALGVVGLLIKIPKNKL